MSDGGREPLLLHPRARRHAAASGTRSSPLLAARARGDRARHARLRRRAAAARRGRADRREPRRARPATRCAELGIERPHVAGNSLGGWVGLEMGRAGWAALGHGALPRRPLAQRRSARASRDTARSGAAAAAAGRARRCASGAAAPRDALAPSPPTPSGSRPPQAASWSSAGSTPAATTAPTGRCAPTSSTRTGYPEEVPVTIAWGERDRLVGPPEARAPAGRRPLPRPARRRPHADLGRPRAGRPRRCSRAAR